MTEQPGDPSPATAPEAPARKMTPEAALGRHVEWLEFALAAARSEETWRVARLEKANKRNRDRRATRLDEVRDEIEELDALLVAIRELQARPAPAAASRGTEAWAGPAAQDDERRARRRRRRRPARRRSLLRPRRPRPPRSPRTKPVAKPAAQAGSQAATAKPADGQAGTAKPAATRPTDDEGAGAARGRRRATGGSSGAS